MMKTLLFLERCFFYKRRAKNGARKRVRYREKILWTYFRKIKYNNKESTLFILTLKSNELSKEVSDEF